MTHAQSPALSHDPDASPDAPRVPLAADRTHLYGLDYLRAALSVCVVGWHMGIVDHSAIFDPRRYVPARYHLHASDVANFYVLLLAVPGFLTISNYLFARRHPTPRDFARQAGRVLALLAFWPAAILIWGQGYVALERRYPHGGFETYLLLTRAGGTIFYFFSSLLLTLVLTFLLSRLPTPAVIAAFAVTLASLFLCPLIAVAGHHPELTNFTCPLNFLVYAPLGLLLHRVPALRTPRAAAGWLVAGTLVATVEWQYVRDPFFFTTEAKALPSYTRPALPLLAAALVAAALNPAWRRPNPIVAYMSRHSLSLYCLHIFFIPIVYSYLAPYLHLGLRGNTLSMIAATILLSYAASHLLHPFLKDRVLR